jgi:hypothetical protein
MAGGVLPGCGRCYERFPGGGWVMAAPFTQEPGPVRRAAWEQGMTDAGAAVQVFRYAGAGHLFTDPASPTTTAKAPPSPGNVA